MKRLLITGLNGTLAPHLAAAARAAGIEVVAWDRSRLDPDDPGSVQALPANLDAIAHLAMGSAGWAGRLSAHAAARGIPFLFTGTVMVFENEPNGPHRPMDERTGKSDYGRYKIDCEDQVRAANPAACIARIGWQIDAKPGGNNMLSTLDQWQAEKGCVEASRLWVPACSLMSDTSQALLKLLQDPVAGTVHLDSNAQDAWSFDQLAERLRRHFKRDWKIVATEAYVHDQRLVDAHQRMPGLSERLG
ncbi:MAG TPA: sugar nucleotide-binding protein [Burkholderiaceae bacterium]|jgi:dTDP-4-dehydrorhamnose reductase